MTERAKRSGEDYRRADLRERIERDKKRLSRRNGGFFWKSVALIGSVGWPIVVFAIGGVWLGRYLDAIWGTGVRMTVTVLAMATILGSLIAYRSVKGDDRS